MRGCRKTADLGCSISSNGFRQSPETGLFCSLCRIDICTISTVSMSSFLDDCSKRFSAVAACPLLRRPADNACSRHEFRTESQEVFLAWAGWPECVSTAFRTRAATSSGFTSARMSSCKLSSLHAVSVDDIARPSFFLRQIVFVVWVSLSGQKWVTFAER